MTVVSGARVATSLAGDLTSQPMAVLLASAAARGVTGTFSFEHEDRHDELTMREGRIAVVRTTAPVAYLGGILYEQAVIDSAALNETLLEVACARRLHGAVLLERGLVTPEQLDAALVEQTLRRVYHLFSLPPAATWKLEEGVDDLCGARDEDRPTVDPWRAIWRALRESPPVVHVARLVKELERGLHLRDAAALDRLGLNEAERALCERLVQPTTVARLVASSPFAAERTLLLIYFLALARCIVRVQVHPMSPLELGPDGVRERARTIGGEDPHTALGLAAGSPAEAARAAYFRLARLWHPQRIPEALAGVRAECDHVFAHMAEAHRVLTDGRRSAEYPEAEVLATRAPSSTKSVALPERPAGSAPTMRDVDNALARNDLAAASTLASTLSSAGVDGPIARAVVAWCRAGAGQGPPDDLAAAVDALQQILAGDPECARALFYRGQLSKRLGRSESALRDFRKVTRLDAAHLEARRELRLHDMRTRKSSGEHAAVSTREPAGPPRSAPSDDAPPPPAGGLGAVRSGLRRLIDRVAGKDPR